jgi:phosphoribosylanthranilate isomerase
MFVKICGITRASDAHAAVALGASAVGFIFWPKSPRFITPDQARAIVRDLPPFVTPVGVFVNQRASEINVVADTVGLGAVQLHGDEEPDAIGTIARPVVKAVGQVDPDVAARWPSRVLLLVDADDPERRGGTGVRADWAAAARLSAVRPILLAGGINPTNVAEAARQVRPFGMDVSSGVEVSPGIKDVERMRQLFDAIRGREHDEPATARTSAR